MFKHLFKSWTEEGQTQGIGRTYSMGKIGMVTLSNPQAINIQYLPAALTVHTPVNLSIAIQYLPAALTVGLHTPVNLSIANTMLGEKAARWLSG